MTTIQLPEYVEWVGNPDSKWHEHLCSHFASAHEDCPGCAVKPLLSAIYTAVFELPGSRASDIAWGLQDGYGTAGLTPPQGWDWSGIRDSSPAAIKRIYDALVAEGLVR